MLNVNAKKIPFWIKWFQIRWFSIQICSFFRSSLILSKMSKFSVISEKIYCVWLFLHFPVFRYFTPYFGWVFFAFSRSSMFYTLLWMGFFLLFPVLGCFIPYCEWVFCFNNLKRIDSAPIQIRVNILRNIWKSGLQYKP